MEVPWEGVKASGGRLQARAGRTWGWGSSRGSGGTAPLGDLCLHCMEGMVAELLSGRGRLLLGPDESVRLVPWLCFAPAGKVLTELRVLVLSSGLKAGWEPGPHLQGRELNGAGKSACEQCLHPLGCSCADGPAPGSFFVLRRHRGGGSGQALKGAPAGFLQILGGWRAQLCWAVG